MMIQPIRGTHDLMPQAYRLHHHIVETARRVTRSFGFKGMSTPVIEPLETFQKPLGETSDIIGKEMYVFEDRGGSSIVLRPEGTAAVVRAVIHNRMEQDIPLRFFYEGPMFRYDRPQKGRQRQFHQISVEFLGDGSCIGDFEVLGASYTLLKTLGLDDHVTLEINSLGDADSRAHYRRALVTYLHDHRTNLSEESQRRLEANPLRILDSKSTQDQQILKDAPHLQEYWGHEARDRFEKLTALLDQHAIPYHLSPYLVRGLDYYNHTVFEWTTSMLGAQATVLAGGCYQGLVQLMGGSNIPGVGWSAGVERLALMINASTIPSDPATLYIVPLSDSEWGFATRTAQDLRVHGFSAEVWAHGSLGKRFKAIDRQGGRWALVIGEDEQCANTVMVRDLMQSTQQSIAYDCLIDYLNHHVPMKGA